MARDFFTQISESSDGEQPVQQEQEPEPVTAPIDTLQLHSSSPRKRIDVLSRLRDSLEAIGSPVTALPLIHKADICQVSTNKTIAMSLMFCLMCYIPSHGIMIESLEELGGHVLPHTWTVSQYGSANPPSSSSSLS